MRSVYLDNAATTPMDPEVVRTIRECNTAYFANPSSIHTVGQKSRVEMEKARSVIAGTIGARPGEIVFTSGGTESDNMAVIGTAMANRQRGNRIISTKIEHPAILECLNYLSRAGFKIDYLEIDDKGEINPGQLKRLITGETILVSIMMANNETGHIMDLQKVAQILDKTDIIFHTDAVQAYGKVDFNVQDLSLDLVSLSAHKIYGPKGIGALYIRQGIKTDSIILGGTQEVNRRAGTENLSGILGFATAAEMIFKNSNERIQIRKLRDLFEKLLSEKLDQVKINGRECNRLFSHSNIYFPYISGDTMLISLDMSGIAVSTGSACSSGSTKPSHVLTAMGLNKEQVRNSVRFSFGRYNTQDDVYYTVDEIMRIYDRMAI
jgi:cysteine desulfurase